MRIRPIQCFAWMALLCLLSSQPDVSGAEPNKQGREIFRQLCAKCHGRNGEGVKGKYDDALRGDWPIEKLTRYIDKNMPDATQLDGFGRNERHSPRPRCG